MKFRETFTVLFEDVTTVAKWINRHRFTYPVFVFLALFLFSALEASIDSTNHLPLRGLGLLWTIVQTSISCMLVVSVVGILGRFAKVIHVLVFVLIARAFLVDLCEAFVAEHFPEEALWNGDLWLMVLRNSSFEEVREFISGNVGVTEWSRLVALLGTSLVVFVVLMKLPVFCPCIKSMLLTFVCVVIFMGSTYLQLPDHDLLAQVLLDSGIQDFTMTGLTFDALVNVGKAVPEPNAFISKCDKSEQPFGLIVIGESATRRHWSLYGYQRRTTPKIEVLTNELVVFSSVRASYWQTIQAMFCMLTGNELHETGGRYVLPAILKSVGLTSTFASGQSHWGHIDGADSLLFGQCIRKTWLSDTRSSGTYWDSDLIDVVRPDFAPTSGVETCFVHLIGSHLQFSNRYPKEFTIFTKDDSDRIASASSSPKSEEISAYDNSIAYTDTVLADMIDCLRTERRCSFVLYVSDHGETPETHIRDVSNDGLWEIPMIVWFSEGYRSRFPDIVSEVTQRKDDELTNAAVFDLVLKLLRICDTKADN